MTVLCEFEELPPMVFRGVPKYSRWPFAEKATSSRLIQTNSELVIQFETFSTFAPQSGSLFKSFLFHLIEGVILGKLKFFLMKFSRNLGIIEC